MAGFVGSCGSSNEGVDRHQESELSSDENECGPNSTAFPWSSNPPSELFGAIPAEQPHPNQLPPPPATAVGHLPGELDVRTGQASYQIPIEIPPGRVGMQPEVFLQYSSGGGQDIAGVGWSVSGSPRIHRCPSVVGIDGEALPVSMTDSDKLCFDGQRIVAISGANGQPGTIYRTETDNFARIRQVTTLSDASGCFTVETKEGRTLSFGGCHDPEAVEVLEGHSVPYSWALSRSRDHLGNSIDYIYQRISNQRYLAAIDYTGWNGSHGDRQVRLVYEPRPDLAIRFISGGQTLLDQRLAAVDTYVAGSLVRHYELEYQVSDATRRSLLTSVRLCLSDPCTTATEFPATTFQYQHDAPTYTTSYVTPETVMEETVLDYDGDGIKDRLEMEFFDEMLGAPIALDLVTSGGQRIDMMSGALTAPFDSRATPSPRRWDTDFDNDGRADMTGEINGLFATTQWYGTGFTTETSNLSLTGHTVLARRDFDADGRIDILTKSGPNLYVHLQDKSPAFVFQAPIVLSTLSDPCLEFFDAFDVDGNGLVDILLDEGQTSPSTCAAKARVILTVSQNGTLVGQTRVLEDLGGPEHLTLRDQRLKTLDINGDSLMDFVSAYPSGIWLNRGGTFRSMSSNVFFGAITAATGRDYIVGDFDADGRDEILIPDQVGVEFCGFKYTGDGDEPDIWCTTGMRRFGQSGAPDHLDRTMYTWMYVDFEIDSPWSVRLEARPTNLVMPLKAGARAADRGGDGLIDVEYRVAPPYLLDQYNVIRMGFWRGPGAPDPDLGMYVGKRDGGAPDLMTTIRNGISKTNRVAYRPLSSEGHEHCNVDPALPRPDDVTRALPFYEVTTRPRRGADSTFNSSMYVVARTEISNGIGGTNAMCYRYRNARVSNQGRGSLGFEQVIAHEDIPGDARDNKRTSTVYHQDFPRTGRVARTETFLASDLMSARPIRRTTNDWRVDGKPSSQGHVAYYFVYLDHSTEDALDLETRNIDLGRKSVQNHYDPSDLAYGNLSSSVSAWTDAWGSRVVELTLDWDYTDAADWWLTKLRSRVEVRSNGTGVGQTSQARTEYDYYPNLTHPSARKVLESRLQPASVTQSLLTRTTYDQYGSPSTVTILGAQESQSRSLIYSYSPDGYFVRTTTNGLGHAVTRTFDERDGNLLTSTDGNGITVVHSYDGFGRPLRTTRPGRQPVESRIFDCDPVNGMPCPANAVYQMTTESSGEPTIRRFFDVLDREIGHRQSAYASGAEVAVVRTFTSRGEVESESEPAYAGSSAPLVRFEDFDALGRPARKIVERPEIVAPYDEVVVEFDYRDSTTTMVLPDATTISRTYDMEGRLVSGVDQNRSTTTYAYDRHGELESIVDADRNEQRFVRDPLGRVIETVTPNRGAETLVLNGFGEPKETLTANGHTIMVDYDTMGRVVARYVDGVLESRFGYDAQFEGALDYERGGSEGDKAFCKGYRYDSLGRVVQTTTFIDRQHSYESFFRYDPNHGWLSGKQYPSGEVVEYGYSRNTGEMKFVRWPGSLNAYRTIAGRNPRGQVTYESFGNGLTGEYTYLASTGDVELLHVFAPGGDLPNSIQHLTYRYENWYAQLSKRTNHLASVDEDFDYDVSRRLKSSTRNSASGTRTQVDYAFDDLGNILLKSDYASNYEYGDSSRANLANAGPHALMSYEDLSGNVVDDFEYDDAGNLRFGDGRTAEFDAFDRVLKLTNGPAMTSFAYGPSGQKYKRVDAHATTLTIDGDYELVNPTSTSWSSRHYLGGVVVDRDHSGQRTVHYHHDSRLGSTDVITDDSGAVASRHAFGPFGAPRDQDWNTTWLMHPGATGSTMNRGFTGHDQVDGNFVTHMGGRVYDYRLGRFLAEDPAIADLTDAQTLNGYSYVSNDPMSFTDPTGFVESGVSNSQKMLTALLDKAPDKVTLYTMADDSVVVQMEVGDTVVTAARNEAGDVAVHLGSKEDTGGPSAKEVAVKLYSGVKEFGAEMSARMNERSVAAGNAVQDATGSAALGQLTEMATTALQQVFSVEGQLNNVIGLISLPEELVNIASGDIGDNVAMAEIAYEEGRIVAAGDHAAAALAQVSTVLMIVAGGASRVETGARGGLRPREHQKIVQERIARRNARREAKSRAEVGQKRSGEGYRDHDSASKGTGGTRPERGGGRNRERNVGIDEEHSVKAKGTGGRGVGIR